VVAAFHPLKPIPADPLGQRLYDLFGRQLWDFIEAPAPTPGEKPDWLTVTDYQLRPRILWQRWQDPDTLIGVRFESETYYALIDIDVESPHCNPEAIADIRAALETIGITRTILIRSSSSNGLHLYFPLPELIKTFDLAVGLEECLQAQGYAIAKGQLEIFPNPKTYGVERIILYNGHRLPLQPGTGSCLLDDDLNPLGDSLEQFFTLWDTAAAQQDLDELRHALKIGRDNRRKQARRHRSESRKAEVWREDMEADIEEGWSGPGQTNHLLKTIACHGHVFLELKGDDLIAHTLELATHLPGYQQYCQHQHHIERRVKAWCRSVQNYYWPYGDEPKRGCSDGSQQPNQNEVKAKDAQQRIQQAYEQLQAIGLPNTIRGLMERLAKLARCSFETLSKYKTLWHPEHRPSASCVTPEPVTVSHPPDDPPLPRPQLPESSHSGVLHTLEETMKCGGASPAVPRVRIEEKNKNRGVRGDLPLFPQVVSHDSPDSVIHLSEYHPLPPLSPLASPGERAQHECREVYRQCVFQLRWSKPQRDAYIAEHFDGRRFYHLTLEEQQLLVYRLRALLAEDDFVDDSPH